MHIASTPTLVPHFHICSVIHSTSTSSLLLYVRSLHHFHKNIPHTSFPHYNTTRRAYNQCFLQIGITCISASPAPRAHSHQIYSCITSKWISPGDSHHLHTAIPSHPHHIRNNSHPHPQRYHIRIIDIISIMSITTSCLQRHNRITSSKPRDSQIRFTFTSHHTVSQHYPNIQMHFMPSYM